MTRTNETIEMARKCGLMMRDEPMHGALAFAEMVREAEREASAKVVEQYTGAWDDQGYALAQAIRARGQP